MVYKVSKRKDIRRISEFRRGEKFILCKEVDFLTNGYFYINAPEGTYIHGCHTDIRKTSSVWYQPNEKAFIYDCEVDKVVSVDDHVLTIIKKTGRRSTGKKDISGQEVLEGDIIESHIGGQILEQDMVIKYGLYQAYCPVDQCYMDSVGFYATGNNLPDMPIGSLEDYAKVIGNILDSDMIISN